MSHLDTAYKLGALQAYNDFVEEAEKHAFQPGSTVPGAPSSVARGSAAEAVRGSAASGLARSTGTAGNVPTGSGKGMMTFKPEVVSRSAPAGARGTMGPPAPAAKPGPMLARR